MTRKKRQKMVKRKGKTKKDNKDKINILKRSKGVIRCFAKNML